MSGTGLARRIGEDLGAPEAFRRQQQHIRQVERFGAGNEILAIPEERTKVLETDLFLIFILFSDLPF